MDMSLLMTDAHGIAGLAIVRSIGKEGIQITASSTNRNAISFYSKFVKKKLVYPDPKKSDQFLEWLVNTLSTNKFKVFFPINESIMLQTAKNRELLSNYTKIAIPDYHTLETVVDKSKLLKFAIGKNVSIPKSYFFEELKNFNNHDFLKISKDIGTPVLIKPNSGTGAQGQRFVYESNKIGDVFKRQVKEYGPCMIQEFLEGTKYSMAFIFNFKSKPRRVCIKKTIRQVPVRGGITVYGETVKNNNILEKGLKLLKALNYKSIGHIDFIVDKRDGLPKLLDFNPRFFGSLCFPISAGVDFPYLLYLMSLNGDIEKDMNYKVGVRCRNIFEDFKHLLTILRRGKAENYNSSRYRTIINFTKFPIDNYSWSIQDPKPFFYQPILTIKRKARI